MNSRRSHQLGGFMATTTVEQELLALEKQYWQALRTRTRKPPPGSATIRALSPARRASGVSTILQCVGAELAPPAGRPRSAPYASRSATCAGAPARRRVAVLAYNVHEELTVDGKPGTLDAA